MKIPAAVSTLVSLVAFAWCGPVPVAAAPLNAAPAAKDAAKPYTLFVATKVAVWRDGTYCPVNNVVGESFLVTDHGRQVHVPMNYGSHKLQIRGSLQLSDTSITVAGLNVKRAYTAAADPVQRWASSGHGGDTTGAVMQSLSAQTAFAQVQAQANNMALRPQQRAGYASELPLFAGDASRAANHLAQTLNSNESNEFNPGYNSLQMQEALAKKLFDAIDVSFKVSSPRPLTDPYVLLVVQYHDPGPPPGVSHDWIYAKALGRIDSRPRSIYIRRGGFPPGYVLEKYYIHLYDHGREVVSNVAAHRAALTRSDAFKYMMVDYLTGHKGATVPPTLALGRPPSARPAGVPLGRPDQTYYVRVSANGSPRGAFLDEACTHKLADPKITAAVDYCRFYPALAKGRPVPGVARLTLGELAR